MVIEDKHKSFKNNVCMAHNFLSLKYHQQLENWEFDLGILEYVRGDLICLNSKRKKFG